MKVTIFKGVMFGLSIGLGTIIVTAILLISNTPSYPNISPSSTAIRLMTEHMQLHEMIDKNMDSHQDMISRIINVLEKIMKVKEKESK